MNIKNYFPIVLYDNKCYLCTKFANIVKILSNNGFSMIGHYTALGSEIRTKYLDSNATEMFWFIDDSMAFGGRSALIPLLKSIILRRKCNALNEQMLSRLNTCDQSCKSVQGVYFRSLSLLTHHNKIKIEK